MRSDINVEISACSYLYVQQMSRHKIFDPYVCHFNDFQIIAKFQGCSK